MTTAEITTLAHAPTKKSGALIDQLMRQMAAVDPFRLFPEDRRYETLNPSLWLKSKGYRVIRDMVLDDQVKAALRFKKLATVSSGWDIMAPEGDVTSKRLQDPVDFIHDQLTRLEGTFNKRLIAMMSSLEYGFSVTEKVFYRDGDKVGLARLQTISPENLTLSIDQFGNFGGVVQRGYTGERIEMLPAKVILLTNDEEFGNRYGRSDLEAAYPHWWGKRSVFRWMMIYLEKFGIPPIFALLDPDRFTEAQLGDLGTVLERLQAGTSGYLPRKGGAEGMELWSPADNGRVAAVFEPALNMLNTNIARAMMMPGLLGMTPEGEAGSFARSKVNFDVFMLVIESLRQEVEDTINEQLIAPLVEMNFNLAPEEYPRFEFLPISDDVRLDILTSWRDLAAAGSVKSNVEDEKHIRSLLSFPEAEEMAPEDAGAVSLNGAQITAALAVMDGLRTGTLSKVAARGLLVAAGMTSDAADRVIASSEDAPQRDPLPVASRGGVAGGERDGGGVALPGADQPPVSPSDMPMMNATEAVVGYRLLARPDYLVPGLVIEERRAAVLSLAAIEPADDMVVCTITVPAGSRYGYVTGTERVTLPPGCMFRVLSVDDGVTLELIAHGV